jgi:transposase
MVVDSFGMPVRFLVTAGTVADCSAAPELLSGIDADYLLADKAYDTDVILTLVRGAGMEAVIPPKSNRRVQRDFDHHIYKQRHLVENAFMHLKRWRGIATRYAKNLSSFEAAIQICCLNLWLKTS